MLYVYALMFSLLLSPLALARSTGRGWRVRRGWHVHERRDAAPASFAYAAPAHPADIVEFRVALTQGNSAGLIEALNNVSDPAHSQYGQHLSRDEVNKFISPSPESSKVVRDFLESHGLEVSTLSPAGDWIGFNTTVAKANDMFAADYSVYRHLSSNINSTHTLSYSLPALVKPHVSVVHPGVSFFHPHARKSTGAPRQQARPAGLSSRDTQCTDKPECYQSLYGLPADLVSRKTKSSIVVTGGNDPASHSDVKSFLQQFRPDLAALSPSYDYIDFSIDNGTDDQSKPAGGEEDLDLQWTMGLANGIPVYYAALGQALPSTGSNFIDMANTLHSLDDNDLPKVMTTSYGFSEDGVSLQFMQNLCMAYAALGARGVSILYASGDDGPSANSECTRFSPGFPGSCPYVTTVGGTAGANPEVGINFSGGGWSDMFGVPAYQQEAVQSYIKGLNGNNTSRFNVHGRAYPDVAAQAQGVNVIFSGQIQHVGGTSLASPIFAATIALLNDRLFTAGKPPLGFLNPWLYKNAGMLNDIQDGFMTVQHQDESKCAGLGFSAGPGWDPVTGLGTPNFPNMLKAAGL